MNTSFQVAYSPRRRAVVFVSRVLLEQLLFLPDDIHIVGGMYDPNYDAMRLLIAGDQIDESDPFLDPPTISPIVKTETTGNMVPEKNYKTILYPNREPEK